jgi:cation-transporting ATPase E
VHNIRQGLTSKQVAERLALGQGNAVSLGSSRSLAQITRANVFTLFNAVVGGAFLLMLVLGEFKDALFGIIVILNIAIGVVQELRTKFTLDRLSLLSQSPSRVIRNSEVVSVEPAQIVLGDLLTLKAGDTIAADAVVIESDGLEVDESLMTGESVEVLKKNADALMAGTSVMAGAALAQVTGVGDSTNAAKMAADARRFSLVASELRESLAKVVRWISWLLLPIVLLSFFGQLRALGGWNQAVADGTLNQAVVGSVAALISLVPQGLVLLTSLALSLGAIRLARKNVLAQELAAVEGLARVDVVCFDKTGTLTDGKIEFDRAAFFDESQKANCHSALATFAADPNANATASALGAQFNTGALAPKSRLEFSSARKWSAFETETETWILGAPEFVIQSQPEKLHEAEIAAATGHRVLALARTSSKLINDELPEGIEPMALLHFTEQLRSDAQETLAFFAAQEVDIYVISGDSPNTVAHTATRAGLQDVGEPIDASAFRDDPAGLLNALSKGRVIGRVHPEQKKLLVEHLQSLGHVVAMIGDGVNDCLALKQADLGIAMGSGASATKAVANLVILDEKFSSIPLVLAEGRRVVANIERVSKLFLTKTVWALAISIAFGVLLWSFPYLPRQLTALDAFAIGIPAFLLALLPSQARHQPGFLRRTLVFVIPAGLSAAFALIALNLATQSNPTVTDAQAHTATILLLSITSLWVLALQSSPFTKIRAAILLSMLAIATAVFTVPLSQDFFGFQSLDSATLLLVLSIGFAANAVVAISALYTARKLPR